MTRRVLLLCAAAWVGLGLPRAEAQQPAAPKPPAQEHHYHYEEFELSPPPADAIDRAIADLVSHLSGVRLKSGKPLDTDALQKALQDSFHGFKPTEKVTVFTSGLCSMVDPKDVGRYWDAATISFKSSGRERTWEKSAEIDLRRFALAEPPVAEWKYGLEQTVFDEDTNGRPFRKSVKARANYQVSTKVTLTFEDGVGVGGNASTVSGYGGGTPKPSTLATTVGLTDPTEMQH